MKPLLKKLVIAGVTSVLSLALVGAVGLLGAYVYLVPRLPSIESLKDVKLQVPLRVYASGGELMAEFGEMKRSPLTYEEIPDQVIKAFLAAEDDRFFEHPGVDYQGILRAAIHLVLTGRRTQGGSTITMQVARNFFLSREKTYLRKLNEIFLALKIEHELTKQEILELYLNKIYLGNRAYGIGAAAQVYYGKQIQDLDISQMAMIAGLPKAPSRYNPLANSRRAMERRNYVLRRMHELHFITDEQYQHALAERDTSSYHGQSVEVEAPYIAEMVRAAMVQRYGNDAYTQGYRVYTTVDAKRQAAANKSLRDALVAYDMRHGYRGPERHVDPLVDAAPAAWDDLLGQIHTVGGLKPAMVVQVDDQSVDAYLESGRMIRIPWSGLSWARPYVDDNHRGPQPKTAADILKAGDLIRVRQKKAGCWQLAEVPAVSGALVSLRPRDGAIQAMVGGFDYYRSKFNRVVQAERQPGSSFKPFVYSAALAKGYTAASIINDAPVVFDDPGLEATWRPENYSGHFFGPTRLRVGLIHSRNLVSIRLLRAIGIGYALRYVKRFGFDPQHLPHDLSLALGSGSLTPLQLARGYSVFANGGFRIEPYFIDRVYGPDGHLLLQTQPLQACPHCDTDQGDQSGQGGATETARDASAASQAANATKIPEPGEDILMPVAVTASGASSTAGNSSVDKDGFHMPGAPPPNFAASGISAKGAGGPNGGPGAGAAGGGASLAPLRPAPRVLTPQISYLMTTMMRDVIRHGTGRGARVLHRRDLAGKTGTTNDQRDAWFSGFNADTVTTAWVGFDSPRPLGGHETGARAALPMWIEFMRAALKGEPEKPLEQPPGMVSVRIDSKTGKPAPAGDPHAIFEIFRADHVPKASTSNAPDTDQGEQKNDSAIPEQLF